MLRCKVCNCICDPADMVNRICDDCQEEMQKQKEKENQIYKMLNSDGNQIGLDNFFEGGEEG